MTLLREAIGEVLRRHRVAQSRTLRDVSGEAGVSLGYLSEVERGRKEPSSELLAAICAALGVALAELVREAGEELAVAERSARRRQVGFVPTASWAGAGLSLSARPGAGRPAAARPVAGAPPVRPGATRAPRPVASGAPVEGPVLRLGRPVAAA